MPSARKRSIFHLEEEGEREKLCASNGVSLREAKDGLVGLRILIQHTQGMGSNVVIKSSVLKPLKKLEEAQDCDFFAADFLRSCLLCRKELGLQNEVFMYRGDQGFCSVECRCKQILQDERREFERTKREEAISSKARASDQRDDISVA